MPRAITVQFRGESLNRRDLIRRFVALNPKAGIQELVKKIKDEAGIDLGNKSGQAEISRCRTEAGLPRSHSNRIKAIDSDGIVAALITANGHVPQAHNAPAKAPAMSEQLAGFIVVVKAIGGREEARRLLDMLNF